jgi:cellobiose phosphorylase
MDKYLDSGWGYMLNWPTYIKPELNIGRLSFLQPGICENGSVYTHGNAFLLLALLERGMANKALKVWRDINPDNAARPISCQTNVFINGYWGPDHLKKPGYAELPWITGSAGWMYYSVIEYMIGLRRGYNGITIKPCTPSSWKSANITRVYRGTEYKVEIKNPDGLENPPIQTIYLNGTKYQVNKPLPVDGKKYKIEVLLGK